jgi:hypothetical protein
MKPMIDPDYPTYTQRFHLRRQLINELTDDLSLDRNRLLYGITLKPTSTSWNWAACTDDHNTDHVKSIYTHLERQLNSILVKHHQRPCNTQKLVRSYMIVEKVTKDGHLTIPHAHGVLSLHDLTDQKFQELLVHVEKDSRSGTLSASLPDTITHRLRNQLHSVRVHKITDLSGWLEYCTKQTETYGYPNGFKTSHPIEQKRVA